MSALVPTLQAFFTDRLVRQRQGSPHTLAAYRDAMRLLVRFAAERCGVAPSTLTISDVDATLISAFLDDRDHAHGNDIRTRNARLAAIRCLFRYGALRHPEHAAITRLGPITRPSVAPQLRDAPVISPDAHSHSRADREG